LRLLLDNGANANAKENSKSQTALMWAASEGHPAAAKLLIERGADVNARSKIVAAAGRGGIGGGGGGAGAGARGGNAAAGAGARGAATPGQAPPAQTPAPPA